LGVRDERKPIFRGGRSEDAGARFVERVVKFECDNGTPEQWVNASHNTTPAPRIEKSVDLG